MALTPSEPDCLPDENDLDATRMLEAYSPLGHGRHLGSETATRIARRLGRTPAQVLLRWCIERDVPLIAKSIVAAEEEKHG